MRGAIFDLGGVAVEWSNETTYRHIQERYGMPAEDFRREAEKHMPNVQTGDESEEHWMTDVFHHLGFQGSSDVWGKTFEAARYNEKVIDIVQRLRRNGYSVAALSNLEPSRARWLRSHEIDALFDHVILSCEVGMRKPDLQPGGRQDLKIYTLTLQRLGLKACDCAFIDDNVNCVNAAESAGMIGIRFINAPRLDADLRSLGFKTD